MSNTIKSIQPVVKPNGSSRLNNYVRTHLELGRVSNLPTVWSNVVCGVVVASALVGSAHAPSASTNIPGIFVLCLMLVMSTFYIAGMYLNDACDAVIDGVDRPTRPIPSGRISRIQVGLFTGIWFVTGWFFLLVLLHDSVAAEKPFAIYALVAAAALTVCIIVYDIYHNNNPFSPVIMGMCRVLLISTCYLSIIAMLSNDSSQILSLNMHRGLLLACALILCYLCGLTFIAKFENSNALFSTWPVFVLMIPVVYGAYQSIGSLVTVIPTVLLLVSVLVAVGYVRGHISGGIPKAIGLLIAGISLIDAIIVSAYGSYSGMSFGIVAFFLTLLLQRKIAGT